MSGKDIISLNLDELKNELKEMGEKPFRAGQIFDWFHVALAEDFDTMTNLSKDLRAKLKEEYSILLPSIVEVHVSKLDGTRKYLFKLYDGNIIESVLMRYKHGNSVCISSQAGCRMGCTFCASTIGGLERNLTPSEMLGQIYRIQSDIQERISNVVIMGSGEPLDNYDNLIRFLELVSHEKGLNISARNITVSTCGLADRIRELADKKLQMTLAISLHAPNDEIRKMTMPVAKAYSIEVLLDACRYYYQETKRRITFEYSLIEGINDSNECATELSKLLRGMNCHVNLIPVNPIKERDYRHSNVEYILNFKNVLEKNKINVTIRREMGADINAACGQLRLSYMEASKDTRGA